MQQVSIHSLGLKVLACTLLSLMLFGTEASAGVDSYEIYLNNRLLFRQSMLQPLELRNLELSNAKPDDVVTIRYTQCNAPEKVGRGRKISVRDAAGNVLKEWAFKNAAGGSSEMNIPVKDLLLLQKNASADLTLHYSAEGLAKGHQLLAALPAEKN